MGVWEEFYLQLRAEQKKGCFGEVANSFVVTVNFSPVVVQSAHGHQPVRNQFAILKMKMIAIKLS